MSPGEWCLLTHPELLGAWVCFVNPLIDEKYSNIKFLFKTIINKAVEEKNTLECIPNSIKIYSIIHSF